MPPRIPRHVAEHQGAHFRECSAAPARPAGRRTNHLRALVEAGLLARTELGGEAHDFPPQRPRRERSVLAALRHPPRARLALAVRARGRAHLKDLALAASSPGHAPRHPRVLVRAGVLFRMERDGRVRYGPSDPALLAELLTGPAARASPRRGTARGPAPR